MFHRPDGLGAVNARVLSRAGPHFAFHTLTTTLNLAQRLSPLSKTFVTLLSFQTRTEMQLKQISVLAAVFTGLPLTLGQSGDVSKCRRRSFVQPESRLTSVMLAADVPTASGGGALPPMTSGEGLPRCAMSPSLLLVYF